MKGLWIKDIRSLLKCKRMLFLSTIGILFFYGMMGLESLLLYFGIFASLGYMTTVLLNDEQDGVGSFLFTLPFIRKQYVQEKYMFGIVSGLCNTVFFGSATILIRSVKTGLFSNIVFGEMMVTLLLALFLVAIQLPICFKVGVEKGRYICAVSVGILFALIGYLVSLHDEYYQIFFENIVRKKELYICLFTMIVIVILIISYIFSVKIVEKKEYS